MRVRGSNERITVGEYARQAADRIEARIAEILADADEDTVLPPVDQVADHLDDLILTVAGDRERNELAALVGPFWSSTKVRSALGIPTRQGLELHRRSGAILGLHTSDGATIYPVSQFQARNGKVEVKAGLKPFLAALKDQPEWSVAVLMRTPAPELQGRTPLEWVRNNGDSDTLLNLVRIIASEWSH